MLDKSFEPVGVAQRINGVQVAGFEQIPVNKRIVPIPVVCCAVNNIFKLRNNNNC
jgi:hypothetical protein